MSYKLELSNVMAKLRKDSNQTWQLGVAVGTMLYHISPLLTTHLDNPDNFQNKTPEAFTWAIGFVAAIDQYIAHLRLADGCTEKFPNDRDVDRKGRKLRRKYMERYTFMVEVAYKNHIREALADVFRGWTKEQTRAFNKGVDKALSGVQWVVYTDSNVVVEAGEGDWAVWIRGRCEELGRAEAKAGRKVLEDM